MPKSIDRRPLLRKIDWNNLSIHHVSPDDVQQWINEYGSEILFQVDDRGFAAIHWASFLGLHEITEFLLKNGVPVETRAEITNKPESIHLASMEGHREVIDVLLANGADVNSRDEFQCTPLMRAVISGSNHCRNSETVLHLLCRGGDPYLDDRLKFNCLHYAAMKEDEESVHLLMTIGLDPNKKSKSGLKPLHLAWYNGNYSLIKTLTPLTESPWKATRLTPHKSLQSILDDLLILVSRCFILSAFTGAMCLVYPVYVFQIIPATSDHYVLHGILMTSGTCIWYYWYQTWWKDPGYLPVDTADYHRVMDAKLATIGEPKRQSGKLASIPHSEVRLCHSCKIIQPNRSKHCRFCRRCVLVYDHHCIYLNTCVGRYNRLAFLYLTINLFITGFLLASIASIHAQRQSWELNYSHFGLIAFSFKLLAFGSLLSICTLRRAALNITQDEEAKRSRRVGIVGRRNSHKSIRSRNYSRKHSKLRNLIDFFTGSGGKKSIK